MKLLLSVLTSVSVTNSVRLIPVFGTTLAPDFARKEGKAPTPCPLSHPFVANYGYTCCVSPYES